MKFLRSKKMIKLSSIGWVSLILLIIGGLNWGFVGLFEFDLVAAIFGTMTALSRIIYIVVGICAIYMIVETAMAARWKYNETHRPHPVV